MNTQQQFSVQSVWWLPFVQGVVALAVGLWALTRTEDTLATILFFFGLYWLLSGIASVTAAVRGTGRQPRSWQLISGILSTVAGLFAISEPFMAGIFSATVIGTLVGLAAIVSGLLNIMSTRAFIQRVQARATWSNYLPGALNIIFGIIVMSNPVFTITFIIRIFAILAVIAGLALIGVGWRLRSLN